MSRPRYESEDDRKAEREVADYLEKYHGLRCHKLPISYRVDWVVFKKDSFFGFIELKTRTFEKNRFPTLIISLGKYSTGCHLARCSGGAFWVAARWTDALGFYRVDDVVADITMGGRKDRGDKDDIEPVVHFPVDEFTDKPNLYEQ